MYNNDSFIDLLKTFTRAPSVVGAEHAFFRVLHRELEERGAKVTYYEGVLVAQGSDPDSIMYSAHIDRHGLVCTGPKEFQYAAFIAGSRSDLLGNSVAEEMMLTIADRFQGLPVYGYVPWSGAYLGAGKITNSYICEFRNNLIFEVSGLDHLIAGTPVAFRDQLQIQDDSFSGQLDNLLSAAVLVYLFELGFKGTAFFTAGEEIGRSWRYLFEWFRRFGGSTNQLIVLDTSPYPDEVAASQQSLVLRNRDANAVFNKVLTKHIERLCKGHKISVSYKDKYISQQNKQRALEDKPPLSLGSTEMGRIIKASKGLVIGTTLQVPTTEYHTMNETASISSCQDLITVTSELAGLG